RPGPPRVRGPAARRGGGGDRLRAPRAPPPSRFAFLMLPFGLAFGFVSFALPVLAPRRGIPDATIAKVIAAAYLVHTFKPLWAPIVDTTLDRKVWYLIALTLTAV